MLATMLVIGATVVAIFTAPSITVDVLHPTWEDSGVVDSLEEFEHPAVKTIDVANAQMRRLFMPQDYADPLSLSLRMPNKALS